jgi:RHS repeat-associated protein
VQATTGRQVTNYLWDELSQYGDVVLETDGSGALLASYVLAGPELISQRRAGSTSYYLHDAQGSVRTLTDLAGAVTEKYTYAAFGELVEQEGATENPYRYTGQQYGEASGLYSLRARYYDPAAGRFLSRDKGVVDLLDPSEYNRYPYVANNPVNGIDPSGYQITIDYGYGTSERGSHTAKATGPTRKAIMQSKELGQRFATNSRNLTYQLRHKVVSQYGRGSESWFRNVTVGQTEINGQSVVAINGGVPQEIVAALQELSPGAVQAPGRQCVERFLFEEAAQIATESGTPVGQVIKAIGISNSAGPCPLCKAAVAVQIPVFFLGRLLPYLL